MKLKYQIVMITFIIGICLTLVFSFALYTRNKYMKAYDDGVSLLESRDYMDAINCFNEIPNYIEYRDISELLREYEVKDVCPYCGHVLK